MPDRGYFWFECWNDDTTEIDHAFWWKRCEVPECEHGVCHRLSDRFCYPHSPAGKVIRKALDEAKKAEPKTEVDNV